MDVIDVLLLAGGRGMRMGGDKARTPFLGEALIRKVVSRLLTERITPVKSNIALGKIVINVRDARQK